VESELTKGRIRAELEAAEAAKLKERGRATAVTGRMKELEARLQAEQASTDAIQAQLRVLEPVRLTMALAQQAQQAPAPPSPTKSAGGATPTALGASAAAVAAPPPPAPARVSMPISIIECVESGSAAAPVLLPVGVATVSSGAAGGDGPRGAAAGGAQGDASGVKMSISVAPVEDKEKIVKIKVRGKTCFESPL
jgi:hypothetical protein